MTEGLINHLWQSTLFGCAAALLTLCFRRNGAHIRFLIWFAASLKFLIPFPILMLIGEQLRGTSMADGYVPSGMAVFLDQIAQPGVMVTSSFATVPLTNTPAHHGYWAAWVIIVAIWGIGLAGLTSYRLIQWLRLRAIVRAAAPVEIDAPIPVLETRTAVEPAVFGIFAPVLLVPNGIAAHLAPEQLDTILAHELCHLRRSDNLTAAFHMAAETLFWFHPMVWWLGSKMIVERERACDEAVIGSGTDRQVYAEGILKVCRLYVEPKLICISGISGGKLKKRIEEIMTNQVVALHSAKKCLLSASALVAVIAPIAVGFVSTSRGAAQAQDAGTDGDMRHYQSSYWHYGLNIPKNWSSSLPRCPNCVIRFTSEEGGRQHLMTISRAPRDPQQTPKSYSDQLQQYQASRGFAHFVAGETTLGPRRVLTLDFDKVLHDGRTWSVRYYFVTSKTLVYILDFATSARDAMFGQFDRVAKSFTFDESAVAEPAIRVDPKILDRYVGWYQLTSTQVFEVTRDGDHLDVQPTASPRLPVFPRSDREFEWRTLDAQFIFQVERGQVTGLVMHHDGGTWFLTRIDDAQARAVRDDVSKRFKDQTATPGTDIAIRRLVDEFQHRHVDYRDFTPQFSLIARQNEQHTEETIANLGALRSMTFKGVDAGGGEIYNLNFVNGTLEWRIALALDGKVGNMELHQLP
jgi:beta-lactamase regulating signal transducer with metallopeptidase domain